MKTIYSMILVAAGAFTSHAATIQFSSNSTLADATQYNSVGNNVVITKNPAWANPIAGSQWISFSNTGDPSSAGYSSPANGTIVSFFQGFTLTAADLSTNGVVSLYADDSAATTLNGHLLQSEASGAGNSYSTCSDTQPNCTKATKLVLPSTYFVVGNNVLKFDVAQRAGSSFGLDYSGSAGATAAPEPATWAFLATGLLALGFGRRRQTVRTS